MKVWGQMRQGHRRLVVLVVSVALGPLTLTACGATVTAPDVVGMRLDDAHRAFEELDVDDFEDVDGIEDRSIFRDANWVVVEQDPAAGTEDVDTGTTVTLTVANEDDDELLGLIPGDSPVAREFGQAAEENRRKAAEEQAAAEAEAAEEHEREEADRAQRQKAAAAYVADLSSVFEGFASVLALYDENASSVHRAGGGPVVAAKNALAARDFFETGASGLAGASPPHDADLGQVNVDLALAMATMVEACDQLLVAIDTGAPSALAAERRARDQARAAWVDAATAVYGAAGMEPVLPEQ